MQNLRLLFIFPPAARLQGGSHRSIYNAFINAVKSIESSAPKVSILAPEGSKLESVDAELIGIKGDLHDDISDLPKDIYPIPSNSYLANALTHAKSKESDYDIIINLAHDWLPYYLTAFFDTPLIHRANVAEVDDVTAQIIKKISRDYPKHVGCISKFQADILDIADSSSFIGQGIDTDNYPFSSSPHPKTLGFFARIRPEKGLEDAAEAAKRSGYTLKVAGYIENQDYWNDIHSIYKDTIDYLGFLDSKELAETMGSCVATLSTHKWNEAFGQSLIESMACGTPVVAYNKAGPAEIISDQKTGFLCAPDDIDELCSAISNMDIINRAECRQHVENTYSIKALGDRYAAWFSYFTN